MTDGRWYFERGAAVSVVARLALLGPADFDRAALRAVLIVWRAVEARWVVVRCVSGRDDRERIADLGELLFGERPWSQAALIDVMGGLGCVEAHIAALPPPGELVLKPKAARAVGSAVPALAPAPRRKRRGRAECSVQSVLL